MQASIIGMDRETYIARAPETRIDHASLRTMLDLATRQALLRALLDDVNEAGYARYPNAITERPQCLWIDDAAHEWYIVRVSIQLGLLKECVSADNKEAQLTLTSRGKVQLKMPAWALQVA